MRIFPAPAATALPSARTTCFLTDMQFQRFRPAQINDGAVGHESALSAITESCATTGSHFFGIPDVGFEPLTRGMIKHLGTTKENFDHVGLSSSGQLLLKNEQAPGHWRA